MKLSRFKRKALVKERPFLGELFCDSTEEISFQRVSKELLSIRPSQFYWDGSMGDISKGTAIHFVMEDGTLHKEAVRPDTEFGSNYAHSAHSSTTGESIAEALDREGDRGIALIIKEDYYSNSFPTHWVGSRRSLTVYKLPKKGNLADLVDAIEADEIKGEVDVFINATTA